MPLTNLLGEREALNKNSEDYQEKIIELMKLRGYYLTDRSTAFGGLRDLKFELPEIRGDRPVWVETKWKKQRRHETGFLREMGKYFIHYMSRPVDERFDLVLFIRELSNFQEWEYIFNVEKQKAESVQEFYERTKTCEELSKKQSGEIEDYGIDWFEVFIGDTHVFQSDYESLLLKIDELEREEYFQPDFFTREAEPISGTDEITLNVVSIDELPEMLWVGKEAEEITQQQAIEGTPYTIPVWFEDNSVFSLISSEDLPGSQTQFIEDSSLVEYDFADWITGDTSRRKIAKRVLRALVLSRAKERGFLVNYYRRDYHVYAGHIPGDEVTKRDGRQVVKHFKDTADPFYRHRTIKHGILEYSGQFYIRMMPAQLFTRDGQENQIAGEDAKRLHDRFSPSKFMNNRKVRRRIQHWQGLLDYGETKYDNQGISTTPITLTVKKRPPKDAEERDNSMTNTWLEEWL